MRPVLPHKINPIVRNDGISEQTMRAWMEGVTNFYSFFARRIIVINKIDDFDTQTETTITLKSGYTYVIGDEITTSKGFVATGGFSMTAFSGAVNTLTYTGNGVMFTLTDCVANVFALGLSFPNGTLMNFTGTGISIFETCGFFNGKNIGEINGEGFANINWSNCTFYLITGDGLALNDDIFVMSMTRVFWNSTSATHIAIDMTNALITTMELRDFEPLGVSGSIAIKGLTDSQNIVAGNIASIESSNFQNSAMTPLDGIAVSDVRFEFSDCGGLQDTISDALIYFRNNVTNTTFSAVNTPTKVVATWVTERLSKFSHSTGTVVSLGERQAVFPIDLTLYVRATTGTSVLVVAHIYVNGASISYSEQISVSNLIPSRVIIPWQVLLNEGDEIEIWIENKTNANAILVQGGTLRLR